MNSEFEFPEEKLAKLIGIVQSYPCLYDKSNNSYKNSRKRVWVWHKIGHEIDVPGKIGRTMAPERENNRAFVWKVPNVRKCGKSYETNSCESARRMKSAR